MKAGQAVRAAAVSELFLQASLDPQGWLPALDALASATGSMRGQLLGVDVRGDLVFNFVTQVDESFWADFLSVEGHHDSRVNYRVAASLAAAPGALIFEDQYQPMKARQGWTSYEEACEKHGLPFGCQMALTGGADALVGLALLRSRADGPTTADSRKLFQAIAPSARTAARLQMAIEGRGAALVRGALDAVAAPALLIDGFARVAAATPAAERILATTRRLQVRGGALLASTPAQTREIEAALFDVLHRRRLEAAVLLRGGGEPPLRVEIQALPRAEWDMGFQPQVIVMLKGGTAEPGQLRAALQREFGLSASEAEVAVQLAAGVPRGQIAEARGTSLGTVRQQIKAIFAKLGVGREAEFMATVAAFRRG